MKNKQKHIPLILCIVFIFINCNPNTGVDGSFFDIPETPEMVFPDTIPEIPNEPGFYINGENKGILLFADILDWIDNNATEGAIYGIVLDKDITINPVTFSYSGKNVFIVLKGNTVGRTITLAKQGALFTIGKGVILGLECNMTLKGISNNNSHLIEINGSGKFIMNDGEITNNITTSGTGGVLVQSRASFTMNGGKIHNNTATQRDYITGGGGIGVQRLGVFSMTGGEISENKATNGGGLSIRTDEINITGGKILHNNATENGGGIYLEPVSSNFTKELHIKNIEIGNNKAGYNGGGIYSRLLQSTLVIEKILIYGNSAESRLSTEGKGGGVYSRGNFIKKATGGIIYGINADVNLQNTASNGGNAVHHDIYYGLYIDDKKQRNTTVTEYVELDTSKLAEWE